MKKIYNLVCTAALVCLGINQTQAQCISPTQYPSATITINAVGGSTTNVTTCNYGGEYSVDNFPSAGVYTITSSVGTDYITVTAGLTSTVSLAQGLTSLTVNIPASGIYRIHIAAAGPPACTAQSSCRTISVITPIIPCVAPVASTITASAPVPCPGSTVSFASNVTYTGSVISYQWNTSTVSATGPFVAIPGATLSTYSVLAPTVTTWYNMNITCSAGPSSIAATAASVTPAATTTNSVPYFEGFEGITVNNQLPNCSWKASNLPNICRTYTAATGSYNQAAASGNKFASFRYGTAATGDYFYSNGVQLNAGVTYSSSVKYVTDGLAGWSECNMMYGTTQTTTGLTSIASATGALTNTVYATISGTFNVATSGIYYLAIKGIGTTNPWFLTWDDLSVTAPCSLNTPTVTAASSSTAICAGSSATLTAGGATSYVWSNASTLTATPVSPAVTTSYTVIGTNAASCTNIAVATVTVNAAPVISIASPTAGICSGSSATLTASGAATYSWSNGSATAANAVSPTLTTVYTATGTSAAGCIGTSSSTVTVNANPVVSIAGPTTGICAGSSATLTASGAATYSWSNGSATAANAVSPTLTTVYTATGTSVAGCKGTATSTVVVNPNPVVSIAGSTAVCAGSSATLTASGATTYTWSNGPTTAIIIVTPTANITYTAVASSTNGCTGSASQAITVNALPNVSLTASGAPTVCINTATVALTGSPAGGVITGSNVAGGVFTPGATAGTFVQNYAYTNTVTGCSNTANNTIVVSGCVGLNNVTASANGFVAYPNPTNGVFTLSFTNGLEKQVTVTDLTGKVVYSTTTTTQILDINIANLANGIYSVKVQSNQAIEVIKVVKQ